MLIDVLKIVPAAILVLVGTQATSVLLPGFAIDVTALFAVIDEIPE
jgi:hypothetical protein